MMHPLFNNFSPKAVEVYQRYIKINNNKSLNIILSPSEKICVETDIPNEYKIHLNSQLPIEEIEINFAHELLHCIQLEEGFLSISSKEIQYKNIASLTSSAVLDLDVNERLMSLGYEVNHKLLEKQILETKNKLLFSQVNDEMNEYIRTPNEFIFMCSMIAFCRINIKTYPLVEDVLKFVKSDFPDIYKGQNVFFNSIKLYGYNSPQKVYKAFKTIIRELKLNDYIQIT